MDSPSDNTCERTGELRSSDHWIYSWSSHSASHLPDPGDTAGAPPPPRGPSPPPISVVEQSEPHGWAGDTGASLQISEATSPELHTDYQPGLTLLSALQIYQLYITRIFVKYFPFYHNILVFSVKGSISKTHFMSVILFTINLCL